MRIQHGPYKNLCLAGVSCLSLAGPNELKLQITISRDKTVLELKQAIAEKSDVEADRQRLIYSGTYHILSLLYAPEDAGVSLTLYIVLSPSLPGHRTVDNGASSKVAALDRDLIVYGLGSSI